MMTAVPVNGGLSDKGFHRFRSSCSASRTGCYHTTPLRGGGESDAMFGPALVALTIFSFVWLGVEMARRFSPRRGAFEVACVALLIGAALWIASVWLAALLHHLDASTMLLRSIAVIAAAAITILP